MRTTNDAHGARQEPERERLRQLLLEGAESEPGPVADADYFSALRARALRERA